MAAGLPRRRFFGLAGGVVAGAGIVGFVPETSQADSGSGRFDRPRTSFTSYRELKKGTPVSVGLDAAALNRGWDEVVRFTAPLAGEAHPRYPGAVLTYGHQGRVVLQRATGESRRWADATTELPPDQRIATTTSTIYDMASVSKLFCSIVVMQLVERGLVDLDATVATYLPPFAANGKEAVTVRMLLTHTSGFTSWIPLYSRFPDRASRIAGVLAQPLANPPGSTYLYSDLNLITLGAITESLTGKRLDVLVAEGITRPLGMVDTGYNPPASKLRRIAATEFQAVPNRGLVWGEVHDENAWSLDGVAGHAGVFSTGTDLAILAQTLLNGGWYGKRRILAEKTVTALITNENAAFPGDDHGLGFELNQRWYMGGLTSLRTAGHTGYTGTSIVIDFNSASFVVLLTNRVHPSRNWGSVNPARIAAANGLADALRVAPYVGRTDWQADETPNTASHLTVVAPPATRQVNFALFLDVEDTDPFSLEHSLDGGATWQFLPWTLDGEAISGPIGRSGVRQWQKAVAAVPQPVGGQAVRLRWTQTRDTLYDGRGLFVDAIRLTDGRRVVLDTERDPSSLVAEGWHPASR